MQQVVYVANPVSGLIHVFRLEAGTLAPLQEVQTGGEVQPWSSARTGAGSMRGCAPIFGC
jgi:6-phosphogluconolactonase (cycloisomerase 2 family)